MLQTLETSLNWLRRCRGIEMFKQTHAQIFLSGLQDDNYLAVKLVTFCTALGNIDYAHLIFNRLISCANVYLWTTIITRYSNCSSEVAGQAILIFKMMHRKGPCPNNFTLSAVLNACTSMRAINEGNQIHAYATKLGLCNSLYVQTTLLDMYAKSGRVQDAEYLFGTIAGGNIVASNSMISCYAKVGDMDAAKGIFGNMSERDAISWRIMISGYAGIDSLLCARDLFNRMPERDIHTWNTLISGHCHNGKWYQAIALFRDMVVESVNPNNVTMSTIMSACAQIGALEVSRQVHGYLQKSCIEMNLYVYNSLVDMYAKCGDIHEAYEVFVEMPIKDIVSFNVIIIAHANHGLGEEALKLFHQMLAYGLRPDTITFLGILTACSHSGLVDLGRYYFESMRKEYAVIPSADHYACLVDLLGRGGFIHEAFELVKSMHVEPHAGVWGALLNACRTHLDTKAGKTVASKLIVIEPTNPGNYVLLSNIHARAHSWDDVAEVRTSMRGKKVAKTTGCSWIELNNNIHQFSAGDETLLLDEEICFILRNFS